MSQSKVEDMLEYDKIMLRDDKILFQNDHIILRDDQTVLRDDQTLLRNDQTVLRDDRIVLKHDKTVPKNKKIVAANNPCCLPNRDSAEMLLFLNILLKNVFSHNIMIVWEKTIPQFLWLKYPIFNQPLW